MLVSDLSARDEKIYHEVQGDLHCMNHMGLYKKCVTRKLVEKQEICEKITDSYEQDKRVQANVTPEEYKCYLAHEQKLRRWKNG